MDQATMAGKTTGEITLGGKKYTLRPHVVGVLAEMKDFVRSLKGDPIKEVCDRLDSIPVNQQDRWLKAAVNAAANQTPTEEELVAFERTMLGRAFLLWASLPDYRADLPTPHVVYEKLIAEGEQYGQKKLTEIILKAELASGQVELGNSDGRNPIPVPAPTQATETPSSAVGPASTSSSPTNTVGP